MSVTKKKKKAAGAVKGSAEVDATIGNYENHPFFIKKAKEAKRFLKKAGLPKEVK